MYDSNMLTPDEREALTNLLPDISSDVQSAAASGSFLAGEPWAKVMANGRVCHSYTRALIEERLSAHLKRSINITTGGIASGTFQDFIERVDSPSSLCVYLINERYRAVLELTQSIAFSAVDLLMGGKGYPPVETRPLSELEQNFLHTLFESFASELARAWRQLIPYSWENVQEAQYTYTVDDVSTSEKMLLMDFDVMIEDLAQGRMLIGVPVAAIVSSSQRQMRSAAVENPLKSPLVDALPLRVQAVLPSAMLTVEQLMEINEGDTLELTDFDFASEDDGAMRVLLCVENQPLFTGRLIAVNGRRTVELIETVNDADL
jgi:flagellar motor switch protein FliM